MKLLSLEQGSAEWRAWRRTRRQSSLAPAVMQACPWQNERDVIAFYRGGKDAFVTKAMRYGTQHEAQARIVAADVVGEFLYPTCMEHGDYGASLDGLTEDGKIVVEAKCPYGGRESLTWQAIAMHHSAGHYHWQIEHQLYVSGAEKALYLVWTPEQWLHIWIEPSAERRTRLLAGWDAVWQKIADPRNAERRDEAWRQAAAAWRNAKFGVQAAELELAKAQEALLALCVGEREEGFGVVAQKITRKGGVDYKAIPELQAVDIERYRKQSTAYWQVEPK